MEPTLSGTLMPLLWLIFFIGALASAVFSLLICYHWMRYAASPTLALFSIATCVTGCLLLLAIMLGAIISL